jgi:hypothetical protein
MQIHLLDCKSPVSLFRQLGNLKLQLCMMILSELRDTYWGADFAYRMFERARAKLSEEPQAPVRASQASSSQPSVPDAAMAPLTPDSTALYQSRSIDQGDLSYPSLDDILAPGFSLGDMQYPFWTNELGLR